MSATLILRSVKGTPLTNDEVDGNFSNLLSDIGVVDNLTTTEKSNLVAAVNEVSASATPQGTVIALTIALG